jgi:hypothetical protein
MPNSVDELRGSELGGGEDVCTVMCLIEATIFHYAAVHGGERCEAALRGIGEGGGAAGPLPAWLPRVLVLLETPDQPLPEGDDQT